MADEYLLQGKLTPQSLENLFELLQGKHLMGTLFVSDPMTEKIIYFSMGGVRLIVMGELRTPNVEDLLLAQGLVTSALLKETLELQKQTEETSGKKIRTGDLLVEKGTLSRDKLQEVYKLRLKAELEDLFTWEGADYKFQEGSPSDQFYDPKYDSIGLSFDLETFLKDLKQKHQEFAQIAQVLDSDKLIFEPSEKMNIPEKSITAQEMEVYEKIDGERDLNQIAELIPHRSRKEVYELVFSLFRKRYIKKASREKQKAYQQKGLQSEILSLEEASNRAVDQLKIRAKLAKLYEDAGNQEKAAANYAQAGDLAAKQDAEQALRHYEKAVALNPKNLPLHKKVYNFYLNNNRAADAVKKGKEYAKLLLGFGMLNRAKEFFSDLVKMAPGDMEIRRAYAENLLALNQEDEAVKEFKEVAHQAENKGDKASLLQVLQKLHALKEDDRGVQKKLYSIQGKKLQALLSISPWTILKVVFLLALLLLGGGYFYENAARQFFLQEGDRVRRLIKEGEFAKAGEILEKIRSSYSLSSVADRVYELEKERREAQQIEQKNIELKNLQKGVGLEVDGNFREALEIYGKLSLEAQDDQVKNLAREGKKRMEALDQKARNLSMDLQRLLSSYKDASDDEINQALQMGRELVKLFPKSVYVEGLRVPFRLYTVPKGADILIGGKYQDTPWTGLFSLGQKEQVLQLEKKGFAKLSLKLDDLEKGVVHISLQPTLKRLSLGGSLSEGFLSPDERWLLIKGEYVSLVSLYNFRVIPRPFFPFEEVGTPLFAGGQLLLGARDDLFEISLESSDPQIVKREKLTGSPGLPMASLDQTRLLLGDKSNLVEWSRQENKIISQVRLDGPLVGSPVSVDEWIYLAAGKKIYRFSRSISPMKVEALYESFSDFRKGPLVVKRRIYGVNRKGIEILSLSRDGTKVQFSRLHSTATPVTSMAHLKENRVMVTTQDRIYCLGLSRQKSQELWSFPLTSPPSAPVLVDGEKVYLSCEKGETLAFWIREELSSTKLRGTLLWILKTPGPVQTTPVVVRDKIYFLCLDGQILEIKKERK